LIFGVRSSISKQAINIQKGPDFSGPFCVRFGTELQESGSSGQLEQQLFAHFKSIGYDLNAKQWIPGLNPVYDSQAKGFEKK
jgi:hypothetical protein